MARAVDEKIMKLTLDMNTFKANAVVATGIMSKLKDSITALGKGDTKGASQAIKEVADSSKVAEKGMESVTNATKKTSLAFDALKTMATGALLGIGNKLSQTLVNGIKKFTLDPITDGFKEYELKMKSMQTIMTNTGESTSVVNEALNKLNKYSDLTIYNFNDMTKAIGSLSTSGMKLGDSTSVVKGFFNLAAGTGVEAARASSLLDTAMVQAIQIGKMDYQNWKQLQQAGMGGPKFKDALIQNAKAMGKQIDLSEGFNESLKQGWATTDVMLATMKQFENDKSLIEAATKVRTFSQLLDTALESVGSGWAQTWEIIFGDFDEATKLWSGVWEAIEPIINITSDLRNNFVLAFKEAQGFQALFGIFGNIWKFIENIAKAIGGAFKDSLGKLGEGFAAIPRLLAIPFKALEAITRKIAEFELIPNVIGTAFKVIFSIFGLFASALFKVVEVAQKVFNVLKQLGTYVGGAFKSAWSGVVNTITSVGDAIKKAFSTITKTFKDFIKGPMDAIKDALTFKDIKEFKGLEAVKRSFKTMTEGIMSNIKDLNFSGVKESVTDFVSTTKKQFSSVKDVIGKKEFWTGLWDGFKESVAEGKKVFTDSDIITSLSEGFNALKSSVMNFKLPKLGSLSDLFGGLNAKSLTATLSGLSFKADTKGFSNLSKALYTLSSGFSKLSSTAGDFSNSMRTKVGSAIDFIKDKFNSAKTIVSDFAKTITLNNIIGVIDGWVGKVREFNSAIDWSPIIKQVDKLKSAFEDLKTKLSEIVKSIPIVDWSTKIQNGVQSIIDKIGGLNKVKVSDGINTGIKAIGDTADSTQSLLGKLGETIRKVFSKAGQYAATAAKYTISGLGMMWDSIKTGWSKASESLSKFKEDFVSVKDTVSKWGQKLKDTFGDTFSTENLVKGGILAYLGIMIKGLFNFQKNGNNILKSIADGFEGLNKIPEMINALKDSLTGMTKAITPKNILAIAGAIGILALSIKLLSTIDGAQLKSTLGYMAIGFGALVGVFAAMGVLNKLKADGGMIKSMMAIAAISGSLLVLSGALKVLSSIDADDMSVALQGLAGTLGVIVIALGVLSKIGGNNISVSVKGIMGIATATLLMAKAVQAYADIETDDLIKGGAAAALALGAVALSLRIMGKTKFGASNALGIIGVATALLILVKPVKQLGSMKYGDLKQGLTAVGLGLGGIVAALKVLPGNALGSMGAALAINMVAGALTLLVVPISILGHMNLTALSQGVFAMGVSLATITAALAILSANALGSIAGAGAIGLVAGALTLLIVPITILGTMKWQTLTQGLIGMGAALGIVIAAGYLATGAAVGLAAIATSVGAVALAAVGIAVALTASIAVIEFFTSSTKDAFSTLVDNIIFFLQEIRRALPEFTTTAIQVIDSFATVLETSVPRLATAGLNIIVGLLTAIRDNIYQITDLALEIIVEFANGLAANAEPVITAAIELAIALINGLATGIDNNAEEFVLAVQRLLGSIFVLVAEGLTTVIGMFTDNIPGLKGKAEEWGDAAVEGIRTNFNMNEGAKIGDEAAKGAIDGVDGRITEAGKTSRKLSDTMNTKMGSADTRITGGKKGQEFIDGLKTKDSLSKSAGKQLSDQSNAGMGNANTNSTGKNKGADYVSGLESKTSSARSAGKGLSNDAKDGMGSVSASSSGSYFGQGFADGLSSKWDTVWNAASSLANAASSALDWVLEIFSPSRKAKRSGGYFGEGFTIGIENEESAAGKAAMALGNTAMTALDDAASNIKPLFGALLEENLDMSPVITPIMDMSGVDMAQFSRTFKAFSNNKFELVTAGIGQSNQNGGNSGSITNNYEFNINGSSPKEIAREVEKIIVRGVQS